MLDDLVIFLEIAQRGSFSKAAADLGITAPTLSKRMATFELRFDEALLVRSARGVVLTSFGQEIFNRFVSLLETQHAVEQSRHSAASSFCLHCPQNLIVGPLYQALETFQASHCDIQLTVEPSNTNILLSQKRFDLAIRVGEQRDSAYYQKKMGEVAVCIVGNAQGKLTKRLIIPYGKSQLAAAELATLKDSFQYHSYVSDISLARKLTASGLGVGLLPMSEIQVLADSDKSAEFEYLSAVLFKRPIYALWPNSPTPSKLAQSLMTQLLETAKCTPALQGHLVMFNR
ncbi:LysR family transcriptional regulator [Paraglaciecola sp.]|uniref:LysR family transcriptional regulator n=1 Tax=Paraglaciecola sp. TaxID=1920173 RepID=UPI0030F4640D